MEEGRTTDLLDEWDERWRLGEDPDPETLCPDDPERRERLRVRIAELKLLYAVLPPPGSRTVEELLELDGLELVREVGRGGMGVVYEARQRGLERTVAVKLVHDWHASTGGLERFRAEARAVAALGHPHIVGVHAFGESAGRLFLVFEFLEGGTLTDWLAGNPREPIEAARMVEILARAVAHAHQRNVVHRDLKPSNILLTASGEPKVADFGLAVLLGDEQRRTSTGDLIGTPEYMAPERLGGSSVEPGPAVDIYALGVILYESLTGRPPFRGATKLETLDLIRSRDAIPPRRLRPGLPRDLETICCKALCKEPWHRYATAEALADDLGRFLQGRPVLARPLGPLALVARQMRRRPALSASLATAAVLATLGAGGALHAGAEARSRETAARVQGLVQSLAEVETERLPDHLQRLAPHSDLARPLLERLAAQAPARSRERLHAALALLSEDPEQAKFLARWFLDASPSEIRIVREILAQQPGNARLSLWVRLEDRTGSAVERLRAACALAGLVPDDPRWDGLGTEVLDLLSDAGPAEIEAWAELLRPVAVHLLPALGLKLSRLGRDPVRLRRLGQIGNVLADADTDPRAIEPRGLDWLLNQWIERDPSHDLAPIRGQANRAAALLAMKRAADVLPLLAHSPDPTLRSYLIEAISESGVDPLWLARLFESQSESDPSTRRALAQALGGTDLERLSDSERESLILRLLALYRNEGDAGLHASLRWLLDQLGASARARQIDHELELVPADGRAWWVNSQGQVFSILDVPDPVGRTYGLAFAWKGVVGYQFNRFAGHSQQIEWNSPFQYLGPAPDAPALGILHQEAAKYCNWVSQADGLPDSEFCYQADVDAEGRPVWVLAPNYLERSGYRLPTVSEWKLACQAGAATPLAFGRDRELLGRYGWFAGNSEGRARSVGRLLPNDHGLFDLYGNAAEICEPIDQRAGLVFLGGSFRTPSASIAVDNQSVPPGRDESAGIRLVRVMVKPTGPVAVENR